MKEMIKLKDQSGGQYLNSKGFTKREQRNRMEVIKDIL